jgi:hypothetical protein
MTETATTPETGVGDDISMPEANITPDIEALELKTDGEDEGNLALSEDEEQSDDESDDEEGLIDIEHDGRAYKIPAELKNAFLRNADYTRKTQALAESRRELESHRQSLADEQASLQTYLDDYVRLKAIGDQIAACEKLDWAGVARSNPQLAQQAFAGLTQLKQYGGSLAAQLQNKQLQQAVAEERNRAISLEQGRAVLAREISGWSPELGQKLVDYAIDAFGFAPHEVGSVMDPRMIKVLHAAYQSAEAGKSAVRVKHIQAAQGTRPVTEVSAGAGTNPRDPNRMSHAEYRRWRNRGS